MNTFWQVRRDHDTIACRRPTAPDTETTTISASSYKATARLFLVLMVLTHVFFLWSVRDRIVRGDPDFTVYYTAGRILRQGLGSQLYDPSTQALVQRQFTSDPDLRHGPLPYLHPPLEAVVFVPFTFLAYPAAFALWNVLNLALLFVATLVMRSFLSSLRQVSILDLVLLALAFFPVFANFHQGQDAILLLLLVVMGVRALSRKAEFLSGYWIGLGLFKYHLIVPLLLVLAFWKARKFLLGVFSAAAITLLLSIALVGWRGAWHYPWYVWRVMSQPGFGRIPFRQLPNLLGLVAGWPRFENVGFPLEVAVLVCSAALLVWLARLRRSINTPDYLGLGIAAAVILALLVGYSTNTYDLSLLLVSLAFVVEYCWRSLRANPSQKFALILPVIPLLISPLWFLLWMKWARINVMAVFLLWWLWAIRREILRNKPAECPLESTVSSQN